MTDPERYRRQQTSFSDERRAQTFVADLGGECAPLASAFLKAAAAAAGIAQVSSDYHGSGGRGRHWLLGNHDALVQTVNADVEYDYLDPGFLADDLPTAIDGRQNPWVVVHANDPAAGCAALEQLGGLPVCVLLALAAPGGLVVERHPGPASALERLGRAAGCGVVAAGSAELAITAAGAALSEIMLAGMLVAEDPGEPRTVLFYSLHRRRRIDLPRDATWDDLAGELAEAPPRASFGARRIKQVGAGALGNWTSIGVALDGGVTMQVIDGDPQVEPHNLNRQVLLVHGVGRPKAPVLARELRALDPPGAYEACARYVERPDDLAPLDGVDALIMAPDNNAARLVGADAAWRAGVPYAAGGTGVAGGQLVVQQPGRACFRCITGLGDEPAPEAEDAGTSSCALAANESIVASNMVVAGLMVSELREALAGRRSQNLRFFGDGGRGNRLGRMTSDPECSHRSDASVREATRSRSPVRRGSPPVRRGSPDPADEPAKWHGQETVPQQGGPVPQQGGTVPQQGR